MADAETAVSEVEDPHFLYNPFGRAIIIDDESPSHPIKLFFSQPLYAPLLFPNQTSDARDHAAAERTLLSYLRLAVYMAIVSAAIVLNFHLKRTATPIEMHLSHPMGIIFFVISLLCLGAGYANYMRTVAGYAKRQALVQTGLKTQIVFGVVAVAIIAACGVFLGAEAQSRQLTRKGFSSGVSDNEGAETPEEALLRLLVDVAGRGS